MTNKKYICPTAFLRDDFQIAKALYEIEALDKVVAERPYEMIVKNSFSDVKIQKKNFSVSVWALVFDALRRILIKMGINGGNEHRWLDVAQVVGSKAGKLASKHQSHVISELYSASSAFQMAPNGKRVLFQSHPYAQHLKKLYFNYRNINPKYDSLIKTSHIEEELELISPKFYDLLSTPAVNADGIICTCSYVKKGLVDFFPSKEDKMYIVPHGVDSKIFTFEQKSMDAKKRFFYAGQNVERKGLMNLLKAWGNGLENTELHMAGFSCDPYIRDLLKERNIFIHGRVSRDQLVQLYQRAHCFIFPSIAEGYGLVLLQALACGTPIIASEYSAAPDLIKAHGVGLSINPFSVIDIREKMQLSLEDQRYKLWVDGCREIPNTYTWKNFRYGIRNALEEFGSI